MATGFGRMAPLLRPGDTSVPNVEKVNAELFTLTYGAIVRQLLTDFEEVDEVNKQLDLMFLQGRQEEGGLSKVDRGSAGFCKVVRRREVSARSTEVLQRVIDSGSGFCKVDRRRKVSARSTEAVMGDAIGDAAWESPFNLCFTSPIKIHESITQMEKTIEKTGLCLQYHVTNRSPYLITRASQAKREVAQQGGRILAVVRRKLPITLAKEDNEVRQNPSHQLDLTKAEMKQNPARQLDFIKAEADFLQASTRCNVEEKMSLILQQLNYLTRKVEMHEVELSVFGSKTTAVVADLMTLETCILDWHIGVISEQRLTAVARSFVAKGKEKVTFLNSWWFIINELVVPKFKKFNIHEYWMSKLDGYKPTPTTIQAAYEADAGKWVSGTPESQKIGESLWEIIHEAAGYMIGESGSPEISLEALIVSLGFFQSVLRIRRNEEVHFLENLIKWPKEDVATRKQKRQRTTVKSPSWHDNFSDDAPEMAYDPFQYALNIEHVSKATKWLKALQSTMDRLDEDWSLLKPNVAWFASIMLKQCISAENSSIAALQNY